MSGSSHPSPQPRLEKSHTDSPIATATAARRIVIPGGSGFLGRSITRYFANRPADVSGAPWELVILSCNKEANVPGAKRVVQWDARSVQEQWAREIDGAYAVINLTGRSVNCRYHERNRRQMMDSRTLSTRAIGQAIAQCDDPPPVWLNSSTATIYKHTFGPAHDEATGVVDATPEAKDAFSIEVATAWERAFFEESDVPDNVRKVAMRTAMVFGAETGGVFRVLLRLARFGLGGKMASGRQWVSWVHETDMCRAIEYLMKNDDMTGIVNVAAPNPVTNEEMMRIIRKAVGIPIGLPAAQWMLEIGALVLRTETELMIKSRRVIPGTLSDHGFAFDYPDMPSAVKELLTRV